jgi:hypothetical protein
VANITETNPEITTEEILLKLSDNHVETTQSMSSDRAVVQKENVTK